MANPNLDYLLSSPFENDRIKVVYFIVKNKLTEFSPVLKKMAASDESLNVRYYARKAFSYLDSIISEEGREAEIDAELEEKAIRQRAVHDKIMALGDSEKPEERIMAIKGAIKYKIDGFTEFLMRRLIIEEDENVIATLVKAFGYTGDASCVNILLKYIKHSDQRIVANAVEALSLLGDPRSFPYVISLLNNTGDNRIAANIIEYLKKYDTGSALKLLSEMISFPSDAMVNSAIFVIAGFKSKQVLPLLEKLKSHKNQEIAKKAEIAIKTINASGVNELSYETLENSISMPSPPEDSVMPPVMTAEKKESEIKIEKIRNMLTATASPKTAEELTEILKTETDDYVLAYAISACSKILGSKNIPLLKKFLSHDNPRIRANAVEVFGEMEGVDLHTILKAVLKDKNNRVRANAIVALRKYPNIDHVGLISEMIKTGDKLMITSAIYAIIQIKNETIDLLKNLIKHNDEEIKERAQSALDFLGNDLNDLNAKKLLNELGIGTKNIAKSAEYIFSKTVLEQLDVAYNDNTSDVNLISKKKAPATTMRDVNLWFSQNMNAILNIGVLLIVFTAGYLSWDYITAFDLKKVVSSISFLKGPTEFNVTLLYTSNVNETIKPSGGAAKKPEAQAKLKQIIDAEREAAQKNGNVFMLFDLGNSAFETAETALNTEETFALLNGYGYTAATFGAKDVNFCMGLLEAQTRSFKLPVVCSHVTKKDGNTPSFIKQFLFFNENGLAACVLGFTDSKISPRLPATISRDYSFKDPIKSAEIITKPENIKPSEYNLMIGLSHNDMDHAKETAKKVSVFDIIINTGNDPLKSLPSNYAQEGTTYLLPSKAKPGALYYGKFDFKYDKKIRSIKEPRWALIEL